MNKELIKQQLNAFDGWLQRSAACEWSAANLTTDDILEYTKHIAAADAYKEAYELFSKVMNHIEILNKEGKTK